MRVQNNEYFFANETYLKSGVSLKPKTWYWIGIFRKRKLLLERPNEAEFCGMLIKDRKGTVRFKIKECNGSLSNVCETSHTPPTAPQTTVSTSGTKTVLTDSRPEVGNGPNEENKPEVDDEHEVDTPEVDVEKPKKDNKPEISNSKFNTGVIIAIVIGIVLLIVVPIIVFVIRRRKVKLSGMVMAANGSSGYPNAKRNVYTSSPSGLGEHLYDDYSEINIDDEVAVYHEVNTDTDQGAQVDNYDSFVSARNRTVQVSSNDDYGHVRGAVTADQGAQVGNYDSFVSA